MSEHDKIQNSQPEVIEKESVGRESAMGTSEPRNFVWMAVLSIVLAVIAWIAGSYNGIAAMAVSTVAILPGALALKSHRHVIRNTAITAIIASAVLLVVLLAFYIVVYLGLKAI